jgi:hypothetical protein
LFLDNYTEEELKELIWNNSTDSEIIQVVERSGWFEQFGSDEYWLIVKDTLTDKHYRIYFSRYGNDYDGYTYMVYSKITEVYEKDLITKVWEDVEGDS